MKLKLFVSPELESDHFKLACSPETADGCCVLAGAGFGVLFLSACASDDPLLVIRRNQVVLRNLRDLGFTQVKSIQD